MKLDENGKLIDDQAPNEGTHITDENIIVHAIYHNTIDYGDKYVLRRWFGLTPELQPVIVADTIEDCRAKLPPGLYNMGGDPLDPCIVETWI
jgi:hypothetical protein